MPENPLYYIFRIVYRVIWHFRGIYKHYNGGEIKMSKKQEGINLTRKEKMDIYRYAWKLCKGAPYGELQRTANYASRMIAMRLHTAQEIKNGLDSYFKD